MTSKNNIANQLTVIRLLLVPVFVWLLFNDHLWSAAFVFLVASITDLVDGYLARKHNLITNFGKVADPIADKALIGAALVGLSIQQTLAWWVTIVILIREIGITVLRFWVLRHGVIPASRGGKVKTVVQIVAITAYLLPQYLLIHAIAVAAMAVALVVTLVTGVDYVVKAQQLRAR